MNSEILPGLDLLNASVILICFFFIYYFANSKSLTTKKRASLVLVTGIYGTFVGVTISLFSFDTSIDSFDQSVPRLISGLKTAFITSLFGLIVHILIRYFEKAEVTGDNVGEELVKGIKSLTKSISDDSESSLEVNVNTEFL